VVCDRVSLIDSGQRRRDVLPICNLYRMTSASAAVADLVRGVEIGGSNLPEEVYPGYPRLVVAKGEVQLMTGGAHVHKQGQRSEAEAQAGQQHSIR
jgi:hypothetical protein